MIISTITTIFDIYYFLIIIYILMSWVPQARQTSVGELLEKIIEPYLSIFRKIIPPIGMMDFSPIIALFALYFIERGIITVLLLLF